MVYPCSMVSTGFVEVLQATHGHSFNPGIVLPGSLYIHIININIINVN